MVRPDGQHSFKALKRILSSVEREQSDTAIVQGLCVIWSHRERSVEACKGLDGARELVEHNAAAAQCVWIVGLYRQCLVIAFKRLSEPIEHAKQVAAMAQRLN